MFFPRFSMGFDDAGLGLHLGPLLAREHLEACLLEGLFQLRVDLGEHEALGGRRVRRRALAA